MGKIDTFIKPTVKNQGGGGSAAFLFCSEFIAARAFSTGIVVNCFIIAFIVPSGFCFKKQRKSAQTPFSVKTPATGKHVFDCLHGLQEALLVPFGALLSVSFGTGNTVFQNGKSTFFSSSISGLKRGGNNRSQTCYCPPRASKKAKNEMFSSSRPFEIV
ncbi:hypothetical protein [Laceyella putida]|uniref:Uncharacterized protein n=1 Tax=Laceyella putida TaxID=110101 RepID=A0ABW2RJ64_9BACL